MNFYHGTSTAIAADLAGGNIRVDIGGGELGQGFYTGEHLHRAKTWAFNRYRDKRNNVVCFEADDGRVENLNLELLDGRTAALIRVNLKRSQTTRTHLFDVDMVWTQIVGTGSILGEQHKWESLLAQQLLNSYDCLRTVK